MTEGYIGPISVPASSKMQMRLVLDGTTYTTALADPAVTATKPATATASGRVVLETEHWPSARVVFGGTTTDGHTVNYQVILWTRTVGVSPLEAWVPRIVAKGAATLSALTYVTANLGATGNLWADTITNDLGAAGYSGVTVYSPETNRIASLCVDIENAELLEVQVERGTAATIDVFAQFGERSATSGSIEVVAEDVPHVSGDFLVAVGGVRNDELQTTMTSANGDYGNFAIDDRGRLVIEPAPSVLIAGFEDSTAFTVLSDSTTTLADSTNHVTGTKSVSMAKVSAGETYAGIQDTITSLDLSWFDPQDEIVGSVYLSALTNVVSVRITLGTSSAHCTYWDVPVADLTAGWNDVRVAVGKVAGQTGNGWTPTAVTYLAVQTNFALATNTLAGILWDHVEIQNVMNMRSPELVNQLASNTDALESNTDQLASNTDQLDSNTNQLDSNTNELQSNNDQLSSNNDQLASNNDQIASNTDQLDSNTNELASNTDALAALEVDVTALESQTTLLIPQLASNTDQLESNTDQLASTIDQLDSNTDALAALEVDVTALESQVTLSVAATTALEVDVTALESQVTLLIPQVASNIDQLDSNTNLLDSTINQLDSTVNQLDSNTDALAALETDVTALESQTTLNVAATTSNTAALGTLEVDVTALESQTTLMVAAATSLEVDVTALESQVTLNVTAEGVNTAATSSNTGKVISNTAALAALETDVTALESQVTLGVAATTSNTAALNLSATTAKTLVSAIQAVAVPSTAEALIGSQTYAISLCLQARRTAGDNTGNVFIGLSNLDQGIVEYIELQPGDYYELPIPRGAKLDLNTVYVDADVATDGVVGFYMGA